MRTTRIPLSDCHNCGARQDAVTSPGDDHPDDPEAVAIIVCFHCGHVAALDRDMNLRALTGEEAKDIDSDPDVQRLRKVIKQRRN